MNAHRQADPTPQAGSLCLLLTLSARSVAAGGWHARVVATSGQVLDFNSPVDLVRFLSQAPLLLKHTPPADSGAPEPGPGLR